jgi:AcrR family transcriptional regulator
MPSRRSTKSAPGRKGQAFPRRQAEVISAAVDVFFEKGYRAASVQDVADKVGVLKGSLYYYIKSKEDLLWWIIDDVHVQSTEILDHATELDATAVERIRVYIERHVEWYLSNLKEVSVFFREWRHLEGDRLRMARRRRRGYEQIIRDMIAAAQEVGEISADVDLHYAPLYVLAAVNAVPDWYRPTSGDAPADIAGTYAAMTVGLLQGTVGKYGVTGKTAA